MTRTANGSPLPLRDAQLWMLSAITGSVADATDAERFVTPGPRMDASARLDVYRSGYRSRLVECLLDDYPILAMMLGEERFTSLVHGYIARYPSASPNLNGFGARLPGYCRERDNGVLAEQTAFAAELATLEWSVVEVLHAEASAALDVSALHSLPPERWAAARFVKADAVRLHRFAYPVNAYYQAALEHDTVGEPPSLDPSAVVVYRSDVKIWRMDLTPVMVRMLVPLLAGEPVGNALACVEASITTPKEVEELSQRLGVWFREWAQGGLFARIEWA
jgi:hypothetical protein